MNKLTFSILLGLSTALLLIFFVIPEFQGIPVEAERRAKLQAVLQKFDNIRIKKEEIVANYSGISEADVLRLDRMIPSNPEIGQLLVNLDLLVRKNFLQMTGIQFQKLSSGDTGRPRNAAEAAAVTQKLVAFSKLPISMSLVGSYENFRQFLIDLESVIRLSDVRNVNFSGGGAAGAPYSFQLSADTYHMSQ